MSFARRPRGQIGHTTAPSGRTVLHVEYAVALTREERSDYVRDAGRQAAMMRVLGALGRACAERA